MKKKGFSISTSILLCDSDWTPEAPEWIDHGLRQPLHWRYESHFCSRLPIHGQTKEINNRRPDRGTKKNGEI